MVGDEANIFSLVLIRDGDVSTVRDEVDRLDDAKLFPFDREGQFDDSVNVVLQHPLETRVVGRVYRFQIFVVDGFAEHVFVDGSREVRLEDALVVEGLADDATDEAEVEKMLFVDG